MFEARSSTHSKAKVQRREASASIISAMFFKNCTIQKEGKGAYGGMSMHYALATMIQRIFRKFSRKG
jgi:hypothetical protein